MCPAKGKSLKAPEAGAKNDLASFYSALSLGLHYVTLDRKDRERLSCT
jgi:hypothetical protein